jgi:DNA primase
MLNGKVVSWTARSILSKKELTELEIPRYKNLSVDDSVVDPKSMLFNLDNCKGDSVILTEGAFDVMRFGADCVCSFGTELSQTQVGIIADRFSKVFIIFDNEPEAQKKARKFGMQLSAMGVEVEVVDAYSEFGVNDGAELNEAQVKKIKKELGLWRN